MLSDTAISALLHVSAIVTILTIAFLGLDSSHIESSNMTDGLKAAKPKAKQIMLRLGLSGGVHIPIRNGRWRVSTVFPAAIICLIADDPIHLGIVFGVIHLAYRQRHVPLFGYFRSQKHVMVVGTLAVISVYIFFGIVAAAIWQIIYIFSLWNWALMKLEFFILLAITIWVLLTGLFARQLNEESLIELCENLEKTITQRFTKRQKKAASTLKKAMDQAVQAEIDLNSINGDE